MIRQLIPFDKRLSQISGVFADKKVSRYIIPFLEKCCLTNKNLFVESKLGYKNLNDWIGRSLKTEIIDEKFSQNSKLLFSPCEAYMKIYEGIRNNHIIQIKDKSYSLDDLILGDSEIYQDGIMIIFRLHLCHYHHFHYVANGEIVNFKKISGKYNPVNFLGLNYVKELFCVNRRDITEIVTENFGRIMYIEVGAFNVGSIVQNNSVGDKIKRKDKKGYFQFGGSTVILLFKKGILNPDKKYQNSNKQEIYVFVGDKIASLISKL
ncbi:phosphatidylserine decarboxylase [Candidatus Parcubacteria bacterium]|nr:phosphatidylserine decarboxylase [Candidatus Parcubacteria bacterium]